MNEQATPQAQGKREKAKTDLRKLLEITPDDYRLWQRPTRLAFATLAGRIIGEFNSDPDFLHEIDKSIEDVKRWKF